MYITVDETKNNLCTTQTIADQSQVEQQNPRRKIKFFQPEKIHSSFRMRTFLCAPSILSTFSILFLNVDNICTHLDFFFQLCTTPVHKSKKNSNCVQAFLAANSAKSVESYSCAAPTGLCYPGEDGFFCYWHFAPMVLWHGNCNSIRCRSRAPEGRHIRITKRPPSE